jgi:hypothetical protein
MSKWNTIFRKVNDNIPKFNNKLLLDYRNFSMKDIINEIEFFFEEVIKTLGGFLEYKGHYELTPEEQVEREFKNPKFKVQVANHEVKMVRFDFLYNGTDIISVYLNVPYMIDKQKMVINGTDTYQIFGIVEDVFNIVNNSMILKVLRFPIIFGRSKTITIKDHTGNYSVSDRIITCRAHGKRNIVPPPLFLYQLIYKGFYNTFYFYQYEPGEIELVTDPVDNDNDFYYFRLKNNVYVKVIKTFKNNLYKRRALLSLFQSIKNGKKRFEIENLIETENNVFFKTCLGKHFFTKGFNDSLLIKNTTDHLFYLDRFIDPKVTRQLRRIGYEITTIQELFDLVTYIIDEFITHFNPSNLYLKRIASIQELMTYFVTSLFDNLYKLVNKQNKPLTYKDIESELMRTIIPDSILMNLKNNRMLSSGPQFYNNNWFYSIGIKSFRSLENIEKQSSAKKSNIISPELIRYHPSHAVVETLICFPADNPGTSGLINPYIEVDELGGIIQPDWSKIDEKLGYDS